MPGLTIGIQDATANEHNGWLVFRVRLSEKSDDYVCYDFETISGGTAAEGTEYSVTGCGTDFLQWKWAEMNRAVGEVAA